jgi:hypothetical protein
MTKSLPAIHEPELARLGPERMWRHVRTRWKLKSELEEGLRVLTHLCHSTIDFVVVQSAAFLQRCGRV